MPQGTSRSKYIVLADDSGNIVNIDGSTNAMIGITYEHHEIHAGSHYGIDGVVDLSINQVYDIQIVVANTDKEPHLVFHIDTESETIYQFYEDVTIINPGAAMIPFNNNRRSANVAETDLKTILNTSTANANLDTATAAALLLRSGIVGSGKDAGSISRGDEMPLAKNTAYTLRFTSNAAGYVNYHLSFYEHTPKDL